MITQDDDPDLHAGDEAGRRLSFTVSPALAGERLDKALARLAAEEPGLSRGRIVSAMADGQITDTDGRAATKHMKATPGDTWTIALPPPVEPAPQAQAIPLSIVFEDADIVVVDKPAGMVVHPAPGAPDGTLVNALLHHCGPALAGIGGERRPGIVHRIDKDTSGLLVVAKTETAVAGLAPLFAAHAVERVYEALIWGVPDTGDPRLMGLSAVEAEAPGKLRIEAPIARHKTDRKRMAVRSAGRHAVTHLEVVERYLAGSRPWAARARFRLETGRTHQIRVHAAHIGHPLIGDPVYGHGRRRPPVEAAEAGEAARAFPRQALHAAILGFAHPVTGEAMHFESPLPDDLHDLIDALQR
ncbi:MAG: RluA family pseudouridine synthase [Pseudomonadota bacterium]